MSDKVFLPREISIEAFKSLLPDFFEEILEDFAELNSALEAKEYQQVMLIAHKLKGSSASYGAHLITRNALEIQCAVDDKKIDGLSGLVKGLGESITKTKDFAENKL